MAITVTGDLKPYENFFRTGYMEALDYQADILNASSGGTILADVESTTGFKKNIAFWNRFGTVSRRDITSNAAQTPETISRNERAEFKTFWKFGLIDFQWTAFKTADAMTPEEVYMMIGRMLAERKMEFIVKRALSLSIGAISSGGVNTTKTYADSNFTVDRIPEAQVLFGDRAGTLKALVMHSHVYFPMIKDQVLNYLYDSGSGLVIYGGSPATMGLPVIVTDNTELVNSDGTYNTLLLSDAAVRINDNGTTSATAGEVRGFENIRSVFQAEGDIWNEVKGYEYTGTDIAANPTDANLADPDKWKKWTESYKETAGVLIVSKGSVSDVERYNKVFVTNLADFPVAGDANGDANGDDNGTENGGGENGGGENGGGENGED